MPRKSKKDRAEEIRLLWQRSSSNERRKWQSSQQQSYDFSLGDQLTKDEMSNLEEAGMPTFIINRITPVIRMIKYFVTANNPRWQSVGADGSDIDIAAVHADLAAYCWGLSGGKAIMSQVVDDAIRKGVGYFHVDVDVDADRGMGEVIFKSIDPFDVYVDPMSRDFLLRDAAYIIVKKDLPKNYLAKQFPDFKRKINTANGSPSLQSISQRDTDDSDIIQHYDLAQQAYTAEGKEEELIDYYEMYSRERLVFYNLFIKEPMSIKEQNEMKEQIQQTVEISTQEIDVALEEQMKQIGDALQAGQIIESRAQLEAEKAQIEADEAKKQQSLAIQAEVEERMTQVSSKVVSEVEYKALIESPSISERIVDAVRFYDTRIKVTIVVGDKLLQENYLANTLYPIVPVPYTHTGTPYPISAVTPLIGKQQEINKAHQILIHNANLGSNLRWLYEEGSMPEEEWEKYSSSPGALLKYRQGFNPPTPITPLPVNQAFSVITESGKLDLEYLSGVPRFLQGDTQSQHETYRGMLAMDEYGTRAIKEWVNTVFEPSIGHLGRVFKEISQSHYTSNKVFRVVQPGAGHEYSEKEVEINKMIYDDYGRAVGKFNDYASARFDVREVGGATMPVNRWALLDEYFRWFQAGAIDDIAFLQETDVRNKEKIIERKSLYSQLMSQVSQLEEALKDRDGTIETLTRQVVQAGIKDSVREAGEGIRAEALKSEAEQKYYRKKLQVEADKAKYDMQPSAKKK